MKRLAGLHAVSVEKQEIVETARLTLGYIYFELSSYDLALKYLESISPSFYDYPDVLLAIGWAALKSKDYQKSLIALNKLVEEYPDNLNVTEAHFVLGQCYLKLGYYKYAINEYKQIIDTSPASNNQSQFIATVKNRVAREEKRVEELKTDLLLLESKLLEMIPIHYGNGIPSYILKEREKIQQERQQLVERLVQEREIFDNLSYNINMLKRRIEKQEMQKDWRAHAEYGKARATFLRGMSTK